MKIIYYVEKEGFFYKHFIGFATLEDENVFEDCIYVTKYHYDYDYKYNKCKFELSNKEFLYSSYLIFSSNDFLKSYKILVISFVCFK